LSGDRFETEHAGSRCAGVVLAMFSLVRSTTRVVALFVERSLEQPGLVDEHHRRVGRS
jgi:hypothetical protein